jgi:hypothetical protein
LHIINYVIVINYAASRKISSICRYLHEHGERGLKGSPLEILKKDPHTLSKCKIWGEKTRFFSNFGLNFEADFGDPCDYHKSVANFLEFLMTFFMTPSRPQLLAKLMCVPM